MTNLVATNLGRGKSIVLAVDRSKSMDGQPLTAVEAARAFVAAKPPEDRISVLTFATEPVLYRLPDVDHRRRLGPTLHLDQPGAGDDAVRRARRLLPLARLRGVSRTRDHHRHGRERDPERGDRRRRIAAAQEAGTSVYVVGIESSRFNPEPSSASPRRRAATTTAPPTRPRSPRSTTRSPRSSPARGASSTSRRLPSEPIALTATSGAESASVEVVAPGDAVTTRTPQLEGRLPEQFFGTFWGQASFAIVRAHRAPRGRVRLRLAEGRFG